MPNLNWDDLRILLAVGRSGGLLGAGRKLGLDHTTVSRRLAGLEAALGAELVERSPRGARLTEAGVRLQEHAERMEAELTAAGAGMSSAAGLTGAIRLATPEAFGTQLVARNLGLLLAKHPGIQLELAPEARVVNLTKREADLAVSLNRPESGRLVSQRLGNYHLGLFASRDYLDRTGAIRDVADLKTRPVVWYIDELINDPALRFLDQTISGARVAFRSSSIVAQQAAVAAGNGVGILHRFSAEQDSRLVRVLPDEINVTRSYWLVIHADQQRSLRVRAVADFLHEVIRLERDRL